MQKRSFLSNKFQKLLFITALTIASLLFSMSAFAATREEAVDYAKSKQEGWILAGVVRPAFSDENTVQETK